MLVFRTLTSCSNCVRILLFFYVNCYLCVLKSQSPSLSVSSGFVQQQQQQQKSAKQSENTHKQQQTRKRKCTQNGLHCFAHINSYFISNNSPFILSTGTKQVKYIIWNSEGPPARSPLVRFARYRVYVSARE